MNNEIQYVTAKRGKRIIHVETELGIVNIYLGFHDKRGRKVEVISMNVNKLAGERKVIVSKGRFIQLKKVFHGF